MNTTDSPGTPPQTMEEKSRRRYAREEVAGLFRGDKEKHRRLHGRLLAILILSFA